MITRQQRVILCLEHMDKSKIASCLGFTKDYVCQILSRHKRKPLDMVLKPWNPTPKKVVLKKKFQSKDRLVPLVYPSWYLGIDTPANV